MTSKLEDFTAKVDAHVERFGHGGPVDDESAHGNEDKLMEEAMWLILEGAKDPQKIAQQALRMTGLKYERWCA